MIVSACATTERLSANYEEPDPLPSALAQQFCYQPRPTVAEIVPARDANSYRVLDVSMPADLEGDDDDTPITFEFYEQVSGGVAPVVVLLPILNGQKHLMRPFATYFAMHGYGVIIVDTVQRRTLLEDMIDPEPAIRKTIQRHRRVLDWIGSRADLDSSRIGVFGASLGGFNALFLAAFDDRVGAVVPALAGGALAEVLVTSDERRIKLAVNGVKEELDFDDAQLLRYLREKINIDTLEVARHIHADRVLMVLAEHDEAVPYPRQLELREAMGEPEAIMLPTGHVSAAAYLLYLRSRALEFFDRKFAVPAGHGTATMQAGVCDSDGTEIAAGLPPDRTQEHAHSLLRGEADYFDSFFGATEIGEGSNITRGSLSVSGQYDERDDLRSRIRFSTRFPLPALQDRTRLVLGWGNVDEAIDGTANNNIDTLPLRFNDLEEDDWLIGVGFARNQRHARGWDLGIGVKIGSGAEPYAQATYRWNRTFGDAWLWQVRPRVFVQDERGVGASFTNNLDFAASKEWLLRSWTVLQGEEDIDGFSWTQQFTAYQDISSRAAMSYNLFATGATDADVSVQDYGFELRFRRRLSRNWLFMELRGFISWPREELLEVREHNLGVGIEFEKQFGDWPGRSRQR